MTAIRLGTRRSPLALAQANDVAKVLRDSGFDVELVEVVTDGDRSTDPLTEIGGTGVFSHALREELRAGEIDVAVHSYKDLPTRIDEDGLLVVAVPLRQDPRDALCSPAGLGVAELPSGARIGTGSPRRAAQLLALGLGLEVVPVRGNVDTRLKKAVDGELDAVVLARAGLARLDRLDAVTETLDPLLVMPAPAQGALAIECRTDAAYADAVRVALDHPDSRATATAERALLATLEGGCTAPIGALAEVAEDEMYLRAVVAAADGSEVLRRSVTGPLSDPAGVGTRLAEEMLADGASDLMGVK
ncbi:MAG TPA: hydroxymethylbilane synthase [Mycobacteriales bacterium]|nr:hydroxymethylbilane synthase [Mycobacteriales bacterium]